MSVGLSLLKKTKDSERSLLTTSPHPRACTSHLACPVDTKFRKARKVKGRVEKQRPKADETDSSRPTFCNVVVRLEGMSETCCLVSETETTLLQVVVKLMVDMNISRMLKNFR